jgi:hypothetical protein
MLLKASKARYLDAFRIEVAFNNSKKSIADLAEAFKEDAALQAQFQQWGYAK